MPETKQEHIVELEGRIAEVLAEDDAVDILAALAYNCDQYAKVAATSGLDESAMYHVGLAHLMNMIVKRYR